MKKLLTISLLCLSAYAQAQFVVQGTNTMTIQNYALISIDGLILSPGSDLTLSDNQLERSTTNEPVDNGNSINRVYTFSEPIHYTGTIGIRYEDSELAGNVEDNLVIITSESTTGNVWVTASGSVNVVDNIINAGVVNTTLSRISAIDDEVLPVTLISFDAQKDAGETMSLLSWSVANEINFKEYRLERSKDGKEFSFLGKVSATGNTDYIFTDRQPATGNNFYRLKMVDMDGSSEYSAIRLLVFDKAGAALSVYPNPVKEEYITIHTTDKSLIGLEGQVVAVSGSVIKKFRLEGLETVIATSSWTPGVYIIRLANGKTFNVVKQ